MLISQRNCQASQPKFSAFFRKAKLTGYLDQLDRTQFHPRHRTQVYGETDPWVEKRGSVRAYSATLIRIRSAHDTYQTRSVVSYKVLINMRRDSTDDSYRCHICYRDFHSRTSLDSHYELEHSAPRKCW